MNDLDFRLRGALVFLVCAGAACTFPDITYNITGAGGGGTSSTTTDTSSGGASTTSMTTSDGGGAVGGAGGGGSASTTTTSDGGAGTGGSTSSSTSSAPGCDEDGDQHDSDSGACGGDDCNDDVFAVHGGQANFFDKPITVGGSDFDYDCNGVIESNIATACVVVNGSCPTQFVNLGALPAACGMSAAIKACGPFALGGCVAGAATGQNATVKCH